MGSNRKLGSVLSLLPCLAAARAFAAAPSCPPAVFPQPPSTTTNSTRTAFADVDGDGMTDLGFSAVIDGESVIAIRLALGDGSFGSPIAQPSPNDLRAFTLGDFDGDSVPDLVMIRSDRVGFFKGNGNGSFQSELDTAFPSSLFAENASTADLDGDGKLDLLALQGGGLLVGSFRGKGDGTFFDLVPVNISTTAGFSLVDLDGDGFLDAAFPSAGFIGVAIGEGDGTFEPPTYFAAGANVTSVAAGDFDGDGELDLVASVTASGAILGKLAFLKGLGGVDFLAAVEYPAGVAPAGVVVEDFDEDGKLDVAMTDGDSFSGTRNVQFLFGGGDGSFLVPVGYVAPFPGALVAGNFAADPLPDVAILSASCCTAQTVTVLINDGSRAFEGVRTANVGIVSTLLVSADFDADGRPDLLATDQVVVKSLRGGPGGAFDAPVAIAAGNYPSALATGDFDRDGKQDFAVTNFYDATFQVFLGKGDGTFSVPTTYHTDQTQVGAIAAGDFDGDGRLDLALAFAFGTSGQLRVYLGDGQGGFSPKDPLETLEFPPTGLIAADLNGDARPDLVAFAASGYQNPNYVSVLLANGDGTFAAPLDVPAGTSPSSVAVADFDEDGALDLAVAGAASSTVAIVFGNGDGTFAPAVLVGTAWAPFGVVAADLDGDGHADVATSDSQDGNVAVFTGLGNGTFHSPVAFAVGPSPLAMVVGDFEGSGTLDVAVAGSAFLSVLLNTKRATSAPADQDVCAGGTATFAVEASGYGAIQYQWRKDSAPLTDGGNVAGARSPTLTISSAGPGDEGLYDVVVSDACGSTTSPAATLTAGATLSTPAVSAPRSAAPNATGLAATVPEKPGHTYLWAITGGTIMQGQGTHAVTFSIGPAGTKTLLSVVDRLAPGCESGPGSAAVQADFLDVPPSHLFHDAIVAVSLAGITSGCGPGLYCPNATVSRAAMAAFILRGEHPVGYDPPAATGGVFADVTPSTFLAKWIEQFGHEGLTTGCGGGNFCPNDPVNRAAMAVFLLRGKHGSAYDPPPATGLVFGDVSVSTLLAKWMEQLKAENITQGCGGGNFCPGGTVTRGEMAAFVKKTFGL